MRIATPLLAIAVIAALAACAPAPASGGPGPSSSPKPTETVEPVVEEETEPEASLIVVRTSGVTVLDEDGASMGSYGYFDEVTGVIAAFSEYFEGEPVVSPFEGSNHSWPGNFYTWDGFTIVDHVGGPGIPYGEDFAVKVTGATVRGITVETVGGIAVGDTSAAAVAAGGVADSYEYEGTIVGWVQLDPVPAPEFDGALVFVYLSLGTPGGPITQFAAPAANYGP